MVSPAPRTTSGDHENITLLVENCAVRYTQTGRCHVRFGSNYAECNSARIKNIAFVPIARKGAIPGLRCKLRPQAEWPDFSEGRLDEADRRKTTRSGPKPRVPNVGFPPLAEAQRRMKMSSFRKLMHHKSAWDERLLGSTTRRACRMTGRFALRVAFALGCRCIPMIREEKSCARVRCTVGKFLRRDCSAARALFSEVGPCPPSPKPRLRSTSSISA